jgi:hypothetical protein
VGKPGAVNQEAKEQLRTKTSIRVSGRGDEGMVNQTFSLLKDKVKIRWHFDAEVALTRVGRPVMD